MEGVIAVITCFAGNFVPKFWAPCNGQIMSIAQNQALFALLGNTYGGDGIQTFALPDLRGRRPVSAGQGPGLSNYALGQQTGGETATLQVNNMPVHNHSGNVTLYLDVASGDGTVNRAVNTYPAAYANTYAAQTLITNIPQMATPVYGVTMGSTGGGQPFPGLMPYLAMNYVICLSGVFPSRN